MTDNPCIAVACDRQAKARKKPGLCQRCYECQHYGYLPKLPLQPLLDYLERRRLAYPGDQPEATVTLDWLDRVCIDVLGVHPYEIYGELYFLGCVP